MKKEGAARRFRKKYFREEDVEFTKAESIQIIDLFSVDGGNYPEMMKELPGMYLFPYLEN